MQSTTLDIQERVLEPLLVAGVRMKGRYCECGKGFATLAKRVGRYIAGKPLCLFYDGQYKEEDADFEPCMPLRKQIEAEGISMRELPGGRCVSLLHQGPYEELRRSYSRIMRYVSERGYQVQLPSREVYLKGPGMFFKGNPQKYVTEIQLLVNDSD